MNSLFLFASLLLHSMALSVAIKCYQCIGESTWSDCEQEQTEITCDHPFPIGNSHCYSVSGEYDNGTTIRSVVARGCVYCSDKEKACELFKLVLATVTHEPLSCHMACCTKDYCNSLMISPTFEEGQTSRISQTKPVADMAMAPHISTQLIIFMTTALHLFSGSFL
ncbi:uncharacterized skeletal organic matrix protein 2-like [Montipora capricornis]|uniref:uncharacterized skeletal organic matrix protein 2-like n=1 Tax=Montipora capricornis TaxID=246305 RepID=UPI0035F17043